MGCRAHIQKKHIVEYTNRRYFNWRQSAILHWLAELNVHVNVFKGGGDVLSWEIEKSYLNDIPFEAYYALEEEKCGGISADELRQFVQDLLDADTGEWAYVDWW